MDSLGNQSQPRDRDRSRPPPNYPRAPSRSSTSTSATRMTPQSNNSSTSHLTSSPQQSVAHPAHRFHHNVCAKPSGNPRTPSVLSREGSSESSRQSIASSYLQERLQKRREAETEKVGPGSGQDMSSSMELPPRAAQSSPVRRGTPDGRRPRSSGGGEPAKKKGMGVKEMEAAVSTLHKQNFDLKLELFHRRERQTALEASVEALEAKKKQSEEVNDKLLEELEKRDKAVQEAVQMIVLLESQVGKLLKEREMVRRVEAAGYFRPDDFEQAFDIPTPKLKMADLARMEADVKAVNRMPSFLSERTENTENLRNVYLGVRGSVISLPRLTEGIHDMDAVHGNGLNSPSLSVLSESSFLSVYGDRDDQQRTITPQMDEPSMMDGAYPNPRPRTTSHGSDVENLHNTRIVTPTRNLRSNSIGRATGPGQFQSITDILDHGSPLQRLERLERTYSKKADSPNQKTSSRPAKSQSQKKTKEEKREALRRVITDAPTARSHHDQALPPTPDTISTSTLRHYKNSNDTLSLRQGITDQRSYLALSESASSANNPDQADAAMEHMGGVPVSQPPSMTAFNSRREKPSSYFDNRPVIPQRPRSADETTVSHRRGNAWDSDDESTHSLESSLDIWLQQGRDPKRFGRSRRASPDLFSFPSGTGGWATDAMFGGSGASFAGPGSSMTRSSAIDDLFPAQQALFAGGGPPPPPNRRSSLHARTGSSSVSASAAAAKHPEPANGKLRKSPVRGNGHSRRNSDEPPVRQVSQPQGKTSQPANDQKPLPRNRDTHYPPISGVVPRGRGLNSLFRRSIGSSSGASTPAVTDSAPASATEPTFAAAAGKNPAIGVPSWGHRSNLTDDDRASATPPPILRNPRMPSRTGSGDGEGAPVFDRGGPQTPITPTTAFPPNTPVTPTFKGTPTDSNGAPSLGSGSGNGGATLNRRKWLPGFGRTSSLRNRAG